MGGKIDRRIEKLESSLGPKQVFLMWMQEAHAFDGVVEYVRHLKAQPDSDRPIDKLTTQVAEGAKQALKGRPREEIDRAVRQAHKDVLFLFFLHQRVNAKLLSEERYYQSQAMLLANMLGSLLREQQLDRDMRWHRIRAEIQMPYPLDQETAAAVEAAKEHHVLTWDVLEDGDDIGQWVRDHFVAKGKTLLPDGAFLMREGNKAFYINVPTEEEMRELFQDAESIQKFLDGDDYSKGLSDVTDAEYNAHYEAIVSAMKNLTQHGTVVDLPNVPYQFLREAPLVKGEWIDRYTVELAEWGARLVGKRFQLEESKGTHPLAWHRIVDPADGSEADPATTMKLWQQTRKHVAAFPGRTNVIDERT